MKWLPPDWWAEVRGQAASFGHCGSDRPVTPASARYSDEIQEEIQLLDSDRLEMVCPVAWLAQVDIAHPAVAANDIDQAGSHLGTPLDLGLVHPCLEVVDSIGQVLH